MYVFDTSSLKELFGFYPDRFPSLWKEIDKLIAAKRFVSVKEVYNEVDGRGDKLNIWAKQNKKLFTSPSDQEAIFIADIFKISHFQFSLEKQKQLTGGPFADPFVISKAKVDNGIVVTQEKFKNNAAKIPNICSHFKIECIDFEELMQKENWQF